MMRIALALLAGAALLSACGLRGNLERPVPLWGNPPSEGPNDPRVLKAEKDKKEAEKKREEAQKAANDAQSAQPRPMSTPATPQ